MENTNQPALEEILAGRKISEFAKSWISRSNASEKDMSQTYRLLKSFGWKEDNIRKNVHLLGVGYKTILGNYQNFINKGLAEERISANADLLVMSSEKINDRYKNLLDKGITSGQIAANSQLIKLLAFKPEKTNLRYQNLRCKKISPKKIFFGFGKLLTINQDKINLRYQNLIDKNIPPEKIALNAELLGRSPKFINFNYKNLINKGIKPKQIAQNAYLLCSQKKTINSNYQNLINKGIKPKRLAICVNLFGRNQESINVNYQNLLKNLTPKAISNYPSLLSLSPKTINQKYQDAVSLLRDNYNDRCSGKEIILGQPQLLAVSKETLESNIQFCYQHSIDYGKGMMLGVTTNLKRRKLAWILREIFDYTNCSDEQKKEKISSAYNLVRNKSYLLEYSISSLEKKKESLKNYLKEKLE